MIDVLVIGSGINGLAAAALLSKSGKSVLLLEQSESFGGAIRTEEVTLPGFRHDLFATNLSLFASGGVMAALRDDLVKNGLEFVPSDKPFCSLFPDGKLLGITTDKVTNRAMIETLAPGDNQAWDDLGAKFHRYTPFLFPLLGTELPSLKALRIGYKAWRALGSQELLNMVRLLLQSTRAFTDENFIHPEMKAMAAIWGMHLDYGPDISGGALFSFLESIGGQEFGMVLGKGGADSLVSALVATIESYGGALRSGQQVKEILLNSGRAAGIKTAAGEEIFAKSIIANVNPALLPKLLPRARAAEPDVVKLANFRPGLGTMMIHLALSELPPWIATDAQEFNYVHIGPYVDDMAITYAHAAAGLLPAEPVLIIGQPTVTDPTRAPNGKHILWIQVRVLPLDIKGDVLDQIGAKDWDEVAQDYADRIINNIEKYAPGLKSKILARKVLSPKDLERYNPNLIKGDSLGGSHHPAQFFLRPMPGWTGHHTPIKKLFICGSGTWPGGGVGGGSGLLVADLIH